ncbi:MAG: hypothetical protein GYB65_08410 [Chloroflexi bacterium]|nr:hypothetical protein [Chloroflexota bacterium]
MDDRNDDLNNEQRPRASLRGRGREILLGQQAANALPADDTLPADADDQQSLPPHAEQPGDVDAAALTLTPEETEALLDFSPSSPAYDSQLAQERAADADEAALDWLADEPEELEISPPPPLAAGARDASPLAERSADEQAEVFQQFAYQPRSGVEDVTPREPEYLDYIAEDAIIPPGYEVAVDDAVFDESDDWAEADTQAEPPLDVPEFDQLLGMTPREYSPDNADADWLAGTENYALETIPEVDPEPDFAPEPEEGFVADDGLPDPSDITPARSVPPDVQDAVPLGERLPEEVMDRIQDLYQPARETSLPPEEQPEYPASERRRRPDEQFYGMGTIDREVPDQQHEGGLVVTPGEMLDQALSEGYVDPFVVAERQAATELFQQTAPPDPDLLGTLVDDERIHTLWKQIEALHEALVDDVQGDRTFTDTHQQELLQASALLLESRANYDDARAIVYRIRADMKRRHMVTEDIKRYRPLLLNYYIGWVIALVVLFLLKSLFTGVVEAVGADIFASLYYPSLFGVVGAVISGYITLDRHTTRLRDFDPIHITWYLFNPLLGAVMGILMYLLAAIANGDLLRDTASNTELAIAWILCVLAGMNQNTVLRQMNDLLKQFGGGNNGAADTSEHRHQN